MEIDMIKRFNNYVLNSMKVAILGFLWYGLFQVPWKSLVNAPLSGKIFVVVMMWAIWSFMVMIVSGELDGETRMLKRFDRYVFNSLKVAITGMCWYALFAIPYEKISEASIGAKVLFGLLVWSIWSFMTMIVELKDDGGKVNTSKRGN